MKWIIVTDECWLQPCLAYDAIGKSIGFWDGHAFNSLIGEYSFDDEYCDGLLFYGEGIENVVGHITHWMPLPKPPEQEVLAL